MAEVTAPYSKDQIELYKHMVRQDVPYIEAARVALGHNTAKSPTHLEKDAADAFLVWINDFPSALDLDAERTEFPQEVIDEYRRRVEAGENINVAARAALNLHPTNPLSGRAFDALVDLTKTPMEKKHDPVNHPSHYTQYKGLEIIDLTEQMNFNLGNAVKYIARAGFKDAAKELEDLQKAQWYVAREIERLKNGA